jgi:hypothetical protein
VIAVWLPTGNSGRYAVIRLWCGGTAAAVFAVERVVSFFVVLEMCIIFFVCEHKASTCAKHKKTGFNKSLTVSRFFVTFVTNAGV